MAEDPGSTERAATGQPATAGPGGGEPGTAGPAGSEPWSAGLVEDWRSARSERPPRSERGAREPRAVRKQRGGRQPRGVRKRRGVRIALACAAAVVVVAAGAAVTGFALVNHLAGNIHRIPNVFSGLDAAGRPVMPAATSGSMTILLAGSQTVPASAGASGADGSATASQGPGSQGPGSQGQGSQGHSGLIALVHINANRQAEAIVSIPPNALVHVPGHGVTELWNALPLGGPSLLIRTVEHLTNVRVDHYLVVDFSKLAASLGPLGGVNVDVPSYGAGSGIAFHPGINHFTTATALEFLRETSPNEDERVLAQQALLYAVLEKIAAEHLVTHPTTGFSILNAFTKALSVDSDFSNSALESLALHTNLAGSSRTYVSAPVARTVTYHGQAAVRLNGPLSRQLWQAIRNDVVGAFVKRYPSTVTP